MHTTLLICAVKKKIIRSSKKKKNYFDYALYQQVYQWRVMSGKFIKIEKDKFR